MDTTAIRDRCRAGSRALSRLLAEMEAVGDGRPPSRYLALALQDADDMGRRLGRTIGGRDPAEALERGWHEAISQVLGRAADESISVYEDHLGRAAYAGGDDLLGFLPLTQALTATSRCRALFSDLVGRVLPGATASSAVVCFHKSYPLQEACRRGRDALEMAKRRPGKDHLVVVALRRGGERARLAASWRRHGVPATDALANLSAAFAAGLAPSFTHDLYRERSGVADLAASGSAGRHHDEVRRLLSRHGNAGALDDLLALEPVTDILTVEDVEAWVGAMEVALFFNREAR